MIDFMVIAAARSATTWAANWLTTDTTICLHDPLYRYHYSELDGIKSGKRVGVSCTGLSNFPEWVNGHPARKVILHRDFDEINDSLISAGLPEITLCQHESIDRIEGLHLYYMDLFDHPELICDYLNIQFDEERHELLKELNIQPNFNNIVIDHGATRRLMMELRSISS